MPRDPEDPKDPLDLDNIDQQIRINELTERLDELGMGTGGVSEDRPPHIHEQFLKHVLAYETAPTTSQFEQLAEDGVALPEPGSLDGAALNAKLWEIINALAAANTYIHHTDHLSDRELHERLWSSALREGMPKLPKNSGWQNHIDLISSGSDEDIEIGLRYYDDDESRASWARDFPTMYIPPKERLPFDRDRHLPKAPHPMPMEDCDGGICEFDLDDELEGSDE